jgi:hypothetical protein
MGGATSESKLNTIATTTSFKLLLLSMFTDFTTGDAIRVTESGSVSLLLQYIRGDMACLSHMESMSLLVHNIAYLHALS